jgi:hypothetical protein
MRRVSMISFHSRTKRPLVLKNVSESSANFSDGMFFPASIWPMSWGV